jgi:CRP-like cAMP-binding protein
MAGQAARAGGNTRESGAILLLETFRGLLTQEDLRRSCPSASMVCHRHQGTLYRQGDRCPDVLCVLEGQVALSRVDAEGNEYTTALLFNGSLLGARDGAELAEAPETARAKGSVRIWRAPATGFRSLLEHHPPLGRVVGAVEIGDVVRDVEQVPLRSQGRHGGLLSVGAAEAAGAHDRKGDAVKPRRLSSS